MAVQHVDPAAAGVGFTYIDETNKTEAEVQKEVQDNLIRGLLEEKAGLEQKIAQAKHPDAIPEVAQRLPGHEANLEAVKAELANFGEDREPRNKLRK